MRSRRECARAGSPLRYFAGIVLLTLATSVPAFANQPPGRGVSLPAILMMPMMALLTALGGGYAILRSRPKSSSSIASRIVGWMGIAFLVFFGAAHEGGGLLVTLFLGVIALKRAGQMIIWGVAPSARRHSAAQPGAETDSGATASAPSMALVGGLRLVTFGVIMGMTALFLCGSAFAFIGYWPGIHEHYQVLNLRRFLVDELAYGHAQKQQTGQTRFCVIGGGQAGYWGEVLEKDKNVHIEFSPDRSHFTVFLLPNSHFPPWPYSLFTTQGSYRVDESGQIRMIRAHRKDEVCPANAPVVRQVKENEVVEDY
jgi:hypothetical protein